MKRILGLLMLLLGAVCMVMASEPYEVTVASLNIREMPSAKSKLVGTLSRGTVVEVENVADGFASFDFLGKKCYASVKFLKKVENAAATQAVPNDAPVVTQPEAAVPVSTAQATIYIFFDSKHYFKQFPIDINGRHACYMEGKETTSKMYGTRYEKSCRKIDIHGEGKVVISYDIIFAQKPFYNSITIDVSDGEVYYVKLSLENLFNAIAKKRSSWEFKLLKQKEGLKELQDKKYTVNPPVDFTL